jgi:hypothetical protein
MAVGLHHGSCKVAIFENVIDLYQMDVKSYI